MRIERVKILNFCQLADRDDILQAGVVGVLGPNGIGKSNYLRAIRRALTGFSGNPGNKEDDLRWGTDKGSVRVDFRANSRHGFVHRDLVTARCRMEYDDGTKCLTHTEIDKKIYDILGISSKVLSDIVFVEQGAIEGLLFQKPSERSRSMQALFGTAAAEPLREHLKTELDSTVVVSRVDVIKKLRDKISLEIDAPILKARNAIENTLFTLLTDAKREELQALVTRYEAQARAHEVSSKAEQDIKQLLHDLDVALQAKLSHQAVQAEFAEILAILDPLVGNAKQLIDRAKQVAEVTEKRKGHERIVSEARIILTKEEPTKPVFDEANIESLRKQCYEFGERLNVSQSIVDNVRNDGACPTCGQTVSADHKEYHKKNCELLRPQIDQMWTAVRKYDEAMRAYKIDHDTWAVCTRHWTKVLKDEEAHLAKLVVEPFDQTEVADAQQLITEYRTCAEAEQAARNKVILHQTSVETLEASLVRAKAMLGTITGSLGEVITPEAYQDAKVKLQLHDGAAKAAAEASGMILALTAQKTSEEKALKQYQEEENNLGKLQVWRDMLERARGLLHRDQLPAVVARVFLEGINQHLVKYLDIFNVPFTASITPEGVSCTFANKQNVPAERLSGGQRVMLGLAFRFAIYDQFVSSLGVMILDEPTVYLDDDHVDVAVELLLKVKSYSRSAGLQLIVVTHDQRLASVFDQTIQVG